MQASLAQSSNLDIGTAAVFEPLLGPARYKGAYGGRGSGKSHFFGELMIEDCIREPGDNGGEGLRCVCVRENQKSLKESAKRLIEDKINQMGVSHKFKIFDDKIQTPGDGLIIFQGMRDYTAETIKSLEGYKRAWVEEGQTLSLKSLDMLRPTLRVEGSELWFSWNPRRKADPVDMLLRGKTPPPRTVVVESNWRDNPWFSSVLEEERAYDEEEESETYKHKWEGDYVGVSKGAYYAKYLYTAEKEGRITLLVPDPLMRFEAFWDIGGAGKKSDATSIWVRQVVGQTINVLDYYEAVGQPLGAHLTWLRDNGYGNCLCVLPHDGNQTSGITAKTWKQHIKEAQFEVTDVKNQGTGAAMKRVEAARRIFNRVWFDDVKTEPGRAALGWYHEKIDEKRQIGLGPDHDWSSHAADAFGLMAVYGDRRDSAPFELEFASDMP